MAMSKKDYEMIARVLDHAQDEASTQSELVTVRYIVSDLSSAFMAGNPRFDPEKFTRACGF